jgi:hypothetical protein
MTTRGDTATPYDVRADVQEHPHSDALTVTIFVMDEQDRPQGVAKVTFPYAVFIPHKWLTAPVVREIAEAAIAAYLVRESKSTT